MAFWKAPKDPFGTAVGSLIDRATLGLLQTEEWGQFMNICDVINATEEGPKDAVKALKKKLSQNCNDKEIRFTLSLLGMCVENCGPRFQSLVVKKDFCKDKLVKLLKSRYNLPTDVQEKILTFIMTWAQGFPGMVDVSEAKEVYLGLLKKGVEFPSSDTSAEGAKHTSSQPSPKSTPSSASPAKRSLLPLPAGPMLLLTPEQIGKLYSQLEKAKMNARVMSSILKENVPGSENPYDMNLLQKLYRTCRMVQERIMELLVIVENEDVIVELIQVNEDLNNVLLKHERFSRNRVRFVENQRIQRERSELATPLSPVSLTPVNLQNGHTTSSDEESPAAASEKKTQSPHYYKIMEFDPLAPTKAIYEEVDMVLKIEEEFRAVKMEVKSSTGCTSFSDAGPARRFQQRKK